MYRERFQLQRYPDNENPLPILGPDNERFWMAGAVFNPGAINVGEETVLLVRSYTGDLKLAGPHGIRPGNRLERQASFIGVARSTDGINFNVSEHSAIRPNSFYDMGGCDDARVVFFDGEYHIFYTAISSPLDSRGKSEIGIGYVTSTDLRNFRKKGVVNTGHMSKAASLFSERVNGGKVGFAYTSYPDTSSSGIYIVYFDEVEELLGGSKSINWEEANPLLVAEPLDLRGPELGTPPIKTDKGWLWLHSQRSRTTTWSIGALLTDLERPHELLAITPGNILEPASPFELSGNVPNVVFTCGAVVDIDGNLNVYYGGADTVVGFARCNLESLLDYVGQFKV